MGSRRSDKVPYYVHGCIVSLRDSPVIVDFISSTSKVPSDSVITVVMGLMIRVCR